jgi:hypothetical protein
MTRVTVVDGASVLLWKDNWNGTIPAQAFPELFSFARNEFISFKVATNVTDFIQNFSTPLSIQAHQQFLVLQDQVNSRESSIGIDQWIFFGGMPTSQPPRHTRF